MGLYNDMTNVKADRIFINGRIYTQDKNLPWADAVACKYGEIIAVGKYSQMKNLEDEYTEITDLDNKFMFPGFIDAHSSTVLSVFNNTYTVLDPAWDCDTVIGEVADCCYDNYDDDLVFAYGFSNSILKDYETEEKQCQLLDEIETECPVLLLGADGMTMMYNSICRNRIRSVFAREDISQISPAAIIKALGIFDEEELTANFEEEMERLTDKGFTTIFNYGSPHCFNQIYMDLFSDREGDIEKMNQNFFSSLYINHPVSSEKLDQLTEKKMNTLKIMASEDTFSQEELSYLCLMGAEKGFHLHVDALDEKSLYNVYSAFQLVREHGFTENRLVIASDLKAGEEVRAEFSFSPDFILTFASDTLNNSVFSHCANVHQALDELTVKAAELTGMSHERGTIEKGKKADFTVFQEDIFKSGLKTFSRLHCDMIVVDGEILYDVDEENFDEMVNLLMNMQM